MLSTAVLGYFVHSVFHFTFLIFFKKKSQFSWIFLSCCLLSFRLLIFLMHFIGFSPLLTFYSRAKLRSLLWLHFLWGHRLLFLINRIILFLQLGCHCHKLLKHRLNHKTVEYSGVKGMIISRVRNKKGEHGDHSYHDGRCVALPWMEDTLEDGDIL